jgi:hypothetical protein
MFWTRSCGPWRTERNAGWTEHGEITKTKLVARTRVDDRLGTAMGKQGGERGRLANWVAAVFWIILSLSVIGVLSVLQLGALSESLRQAVDTVMRYPAARLPV